MSNETVSILSIDAWADGSEGWNWNAWYKVGECEIDKVPENLHEMIKVLQDQGVLRSDLTDCQIDDLSFDDDQYNKVLCGPGGEPLYAIAYGEAY